MLVEKEMSLSFTPEFHLVFFFFSPFSCSCPLFYSTEYRRGCAKKIDMGRQKTDTSNKSIFLAGNALFPCIGMAKEPEDVQIIVLFLNSGSTFRVQCVFSLIIEYFSDIVCIDIQNEHGSENKNKCTFGLVSWVTVHQHIIGQIAPIIYFNVQMRRKHMLKSR